jgi:RimJ/RimL family protein N-acetyltransferase
VAELSTPRLVLRPWRDSDLDVFAALNADAEMMRDLEGRDDVVADGDVITVRSTP